MILFFHFDSGNGWWRAFISSFNGLRIIICLRKSEVSFERMNFSLKCHKIPARGEPMSRSFANNGTYIVIERK